MNTIIESLIRIDADKMFVILLAIFFTIEQFLENGSAIKKNSIHLFHSVILQAGYIILNIVIASLFVFVFDWVAENNIGLLNQIEMPYIIKIIVGIIAIDFVSYWAHRLNHKWHLFWRLHRVHHSDTKMDSSTSFRAHPFDVILDNASVFVAGILFGLDIKIIILRWILYMPLFVVHHVSFGFPNWVDSFFGKIFVTPNFHKVHHHQDQEYTDSNYGNMFIIWDKLFGTFKELPVDKIKYGLIEFEGSKKQRFWYLLMSPFINIKRLDK
ncbi:sterol desaturase family protein [Aureibaculum algae]|uniref:Sterol desaturase family protein n=1 Tax=Aureibaculum algae TaxID=2584122 RepID=A0A5B7TMV6_9FLAO|nr:sterol desaturase family protein [Aureibaculum algae]QCX38169.1 sterol desaturase family protein [Aureibaculum algae]